MSIPFNASIAMKLEEMADLLEQQGANPFRSRAYRRAAQSIAALDTDLADIHARQGYRGLLALPNVGRGIATALSEILATGRWAQLQRLRGCLEPEKVFITVPGIGPALAGKIHDQLHIDSLEGLENAAYDGSLRKLTGVGERRLLALRAALASMLGRPRRQAAASALTPGPPEALLLQVDRLYLEQAAAGELPLIAPRRFNPKGEAWLPILHLEREGWHFSAMYSNTARAHQLERTRDWVVIYFYDDHHQEGQRTLVTETRGPLIGRRVIRGMEAACRDYYDAQTQASGAVE